MDELPSDRALLAEIPTTLIKLGRLCVVCPDSDCNMVNRTVGIGVAPVMVGDQIDMFGAVHYPACGHGFVCPHLAERCAHILDQLEHGGVLVEALCGLVIDDHEDVVEED